VKIAKMENQDILIGAIRKKIKSTQSIIEAIAIALNISYDAAHRRVSSKSKFSIDETIVLCRAYDISMDALFSGANKVLVEKTKEIVSFEDMVAYFRQSSGYLEKYRTTKNVSLFYAAKDIPLFYTIGGTLLSKFKMFVWLDLLVGLGKTFEDFVFPDSFQDYTQRLKVVYDSVSVHEIWNDTTLNSTLQQIFYFFDSGLLSAGNAVFLCEDLKTLLALVEKKCVDQANYQLYYNELLILNNNVLFSSADSSTMFIPYTALGYFITEDKATCKNASDYFIRQIKNSKSLNLSGTRDRKIFFNKALRKIDFYLQKIQHPEQLLL
jgi:hypothetical protein